MEGAALRRARRHASVGVTGLAAALLAQTALASPGLPEQGSRGCGRAPPASGLYELVHVGVVRRYGLRLPEGYDLRRPSRLILAFHGWGGSEGEFLDDATVVAESSRRGYVLVAPRGLGSGPPDQNRNSWTFRGSDTGVIAQGRTALPICDVSITPDYAYPSCRHGRARNSCAWTQCQDDDVDFVQALLRELESRLCVDLQRVYATGGSNGGMFTWELGQNPRTAPLLRAIAPIIGLPHRGDLRPPGRPQGLPVLLITGRADTTVPPGLWEDPHYTTTSNDSDRFYYTGASGIVERWAQAQGCATQGPPRVFAIAGAPVECRSYCPAPAGAWPRVLDCRAPMGHDYQLGWSWKLVLDFFDRM